MKHHSPKKSRLSLGWRWLPIGFVSLLTWISSHYYLRLRKQPSFRIKELPPAVAGEDSTFVKGLSITIENLRSCIELRHLPDGSIAEVLCAGSRNFREPWARDLSFASYGLLALGDFSTIRKSLELFLLFQDPTGQFPVKMYSTNVFERILHSFFKREQPITSPLKPKFISGHRTVSLDGNLLLVIASLNYINTSSDEDFGHRHWSALCNGLRWVETQALGSDGLLHQEAYSDWADSLSRSGQVLYVNILYWKALQEMTRRACDFDSPVEAEIWQHKMETTRKAIHAQFWRPEKGYYITSENLENLSSGGNLLAIAWGLADSGQAESILYNMRQFRMAEPVPTQTMHGSFPAKFIAIENHLAGIPEYHTQGAWLWLGAWHVIAAACQGYFDEASRLLEGIMNVVVRDRAVYEVYGPDGNFLSTRWYTAEAPLSWSAGMIIYACHFLTNLLATGKT